MIITQLQGGLGNQLFQYAAARFLMIQNQDPELLFHSLYYSYVKNRHYLLDKFKTVGRTALPSDYPFFFPATLPVIGAAYLNFYKAIGMSGYRMYEEKEQFIFDPKLTCQKGNIFLSGFWQSAKYANKIRSQLQKEFTLKYIPKDIQTVAYLKKMRTTNSIAVHVRRGDYVNNPHFPTCDLSYYKYAIQAVESKIKNPHFFIFSDDKKWVAENFSHLKEKTFITGVNDELTEFFLMTKAEHAIIANSTFSWWAAWLAERKNRVVIAPSPWSANPEEAKELYLPNWISLPRNENS